MIKQRITLEEVVGLANETREAAQAAHRRDLEEIRDSLSDPPGPDEYEDPLVRALYARIGAMLDALGGEA